MRARRPSPLALLVMLLAASCGGQPGSGGDDADAGGPVALVDHALWERAPLDDDPFADHQPATVECDIAGWFLERGELEMNTGRCNYVWLDQPALTGVMRGDTLSLQLRHFDLTAPEPAEAHIALLLDGQIAWEQTLPIPHSAEVLNAEWTADRDIAAGATVGWHLHNHGQNTWTLAYIRATR